MSQKLKKTKTNTNFFNRILQMVVFSALTDFRFKNDVEYYMSYNNNRIYLLI